MNRNGRPFALRASREKPTMQAREKIPTVLNEAILRLRAREILDLLTTQAAGAGQYRGAKGPRAQTCGNPETGLWSARRPGDAEI